MYPCRLNKTEISSQLVLTFNFYFSLKKCTKVEEKYLENVVKISA